jgi:hypothetical protein
MQTMMSRTIQLDIEAMDGMRQHLDALSVAVSKINPTADTELFTSYHEQPWTEPYDFAFEPSLLWKDSVRFIRVSLRLKTRATW